MGDVLSVASDVGAAPNDSAYAEAVRLQATAAGSLFARVLLIADARELPTAIRGVGEWLVREYLKGDEAGSVTPQFGEG
jgi:hypothetical protein